MNLFEILVVDLDKITLNCEKSGLGVYIYIYMLAEDLTLDVLIARMVLTLELVGHFCFESCPDSS